MGLLGLLITLLFIALGSGYYFFSVPKTTVTITNSVPVPVAEGLSLYQELKTEAEDIKEGEEYRVEEEIQQLEEALYNEQLRTNNQQRDTEPDTVKAPQEAKMEVIERLMTTGFAVPKKARTIDTIVLHSSYNPNGGNAYGVSELVNIYESYGVSAHYLIDREGTVYRLVEDKNIAYHAGASKMPDGRQDVNAFSLGIEIMNKEDTQYTKAQYEAVNDLVATLKQRYGIKYVVGHGDIAPTRKTDPWNFDWKKLK